MWPVIELPVQSPHAFICKLNVGFEGVGHCAKIRKQNIEINQFGFKHKLMFILLFHDNN